LRTRTIRDDILKFRISPLHIINDPGVIVSGSTSGSTCFFN
jgi:hypothetical protein